MIRPGPLDPWTALAAGATLAASCRWNWWRPRAEGLRVLMYHKIGEPAADARFKSIWTSARDFRRQLEYLKRGGYAALTFSELRDAELGRAPMPRRPLLITFDDGFANNYELAYPMLRELGLKANIFLVCGSVGGDSRWDAERETSAPIPMLRWEQIREMRDSGVVEFGSHTMRHKDLLRLPRDEVLRELTESKSRLEAELGREVLGFSYPWGQGADDPEVRALVRAAGYRYDFGTEKGISRLPWDPASGALKRLDITRGMSRLDFHLNLTRGRARLTRRFWE